MFEDSLLERRISLGRRRGWTTIVALLLESALVAIMVLVPLIFTEALPTHELVTYLVAPPPPPPPPPPAATAPVRTKAPKVVTDVLDSGELRTPTRIPTRVAMIKEDAPPVVASAGGVVGGVPGGIPGGQLGGVIGGIVRAMPLANLPRPPAAAPARRVRVSQGVAKGLLVHKVVPTYPSLARSARIQGTVVLSAVIGRDGEIEKLHVISGHPLLSKAAVDAVSGWCYRPYRLNGQPVEVETTITVNFTFGG